MWEYCGALYHDSGLNPQIKDLVAAAPDRRQRYANDIRYMSLCNEEGQAVYKTRVWEGRFQTQLADLTFPRIEEYVVYGPHLKDKSRYGPISISQLLRPASRVFSIQPQAGCKRLVVTDEVLETIASGHQAFKSWRSPFLNHIRT